MDKEEKLERLTSQDRARIRRPIPVVKQSAGEQGEAGAADVARVGAAPRLVKILKIKIEIKSCSGRQVNKEKLERLTSPKSELFRGVAFHWVVQYWAHLQLKCGPRQ